MEMTQMTKQMFDFQKTTFNNFFSTINMLQDQSERYMNTFMEQNPLLPQQGKEAFQQWLSMYKTVREDYKKTIDESFNNLENYFAEAVKTK